MLVRFRLRQRWLKWVGVFVSAIVFAIALAHTLSSSESISAADSTSTVTSNQSSTQLLEPSSLQAQAKYDRQLAHYGTVSRRDGSFRQMFIDQTSIAALQPGEPLPNGALIVMETWYSPDNAGAVFIKQKQGGEWRYGSFNPDRPDYQMSFSGSCHRCHAPFPDTDYTLTKPLLEAALRTQQVQTAYCDRAGRTPCAPEAYLPEASPEAS
ncbi:MAG: cytochrome P460 family protein [Leptolyngbyaceae cyanobacterium MO_188.B28]|nr:cytochrome P460 family protein [Leptolyngbyaceae cyanobacterium MO_188.B28]